jgi:hypothetical protein
LKGLKPKFHDLTLSVGENKTAHDLSYFSKMALKKIAEKTIKIISEVKIMKYVQL